ncbi:PHD and RING finger domain-containing protein 1-like isoform X2 [Amblyraja radiata]|uniref:PHD and RING finger domain-containing protein 1-like isoform X2 n=1 Tax=Amblyraja radiata TaxID=386614 RepID=UPI001402C528|nr:PHD and RING finger domain-containing protein 1-like isoform X2 [Amblyraja radiata]
MDEDQDEPINISVTLGKSQRKREVIAIFSDEESSSEEGDDVDEGDTDDDGEGAEDDDLEDDEDDDDEEDEDEEEEEEEAEDGDEAEGGAGGVANKKLGSGEKWASSSDEEGENCPICLNVFRDQAIGTPENCMHYFCLDCILEWAKNANSCPVDRITFKNICVRTHFGGTVLKKLPVLNPNKDNEEGQEDVTNCEVCGRSDREDSLLLCDGCDAGYHLDCLTPALHTVPVEEWFCPECAESNPTAAVEEIDDEELAFLIADAPQEPTTSRLRLTARRTRAIARTRQSERVRANVNRSRITRAHQIRDVPQYLMNPSLLDETIECVVAGLNTAVYHRPLAPRARTTRKRWKRSGKKRKKARTQKSRGKTGLWLGSKVGEKSTRKRRRKTRRRKGAKKVSKVSVTARSRIARSLGLGKPVNGISVPSVYRPLEPSLRIMRTDIGAASLSVYGDPNDLDPFESEADAVYGDTSLGSPLSNKRRILSRSALRSHRPVARPISVKISRNGRLPAVGQEAQPQAVPVPDVLEGILAKQNVLLMDSSNIVINRDGSLKAKVASGQPALLPPGSSRTGEASTGCSASSGYNSGNSTHAPKGDWKTAGVTKKPAAPTFPSTSRFQPSPRQLAASSNMRPAFSGTFTPMPEVSVGPRPGGSVSFPDAEWTGAASKDAGDGQKGTSGFTPFRWLNSASNFHIKSSVGTLKRVAPQPAVRRLDISEFPRIPKIKTQTGSDTQDNGASHLSRQMSSEQTTGARELQKAGERLQSSGSDNSRLCQEKLRALDVAPNLSALTRLKAVHSTRLPKMEAYDPFEPTDDEVQHCGRKDSHSQLQINLKSADDMYDPFEPTGSDPSSSSSTPDRPESRCEGESPMSSPGYGSSVAEKHTEPTLSLYYDSDSIDLSPTQLSEPRQIPTQPQATEDTAESPESPAPRARPSLDSDWEATCDSRLSVEVKDVKLRAESGVSKWDNVRVSVSVCPDGAWSEQRVVNADSDGVSLSASSDEGIEKAVDKIVPINTRTDVDISSEIEVRGRADKEARPESRIRSRSRSSSHSRRQSKNLVHGNRGGHRSRSRSKERKKLRSHSRERRRTRSRSRSRSSSFDRYRRRKLKQERCREKRGRRSRSRERRSGSSSSDLSTDSHKRRRKVSGSKDHKGFYKHSHSSSERGKRRQYHREQSWEQYERQSRRSNSWSRERRPSRSSSRNRDRKKPWPKVREKIRSWSRSSSRERRSGSRSSSRDKRSSHTRSSSREKRRSGRYRDKGRSKTHSRSKERRKPTTHSRTRSRSRDQSRSQSRERGCQSKYQAPEDESRRNFTQEKVLHAEYDQEEKKVPSPNQEPTQRYVSMQELIIPCSAESSQDGNDLPEDQTSAHSLGLKEESVPHIDQVQEATGQWELPEQWRESVCPSESMEGNDVDILTAVEHVWEDSDTQTRQDDSEITSASVPSEYFQMGSPCYQEQATEDAVSIPLIGLSKEEEAVNKEALCPEVEPFPQPFPAEPDPPSAGDDSLNFGKTICSGDQTASVDVSACNQTASVDVSACHQAASVDVSACHQAASVDVSACEKSKSPVPAGSEAVSCFKSEQVDNSSTDECYQKTEPELDSVCLASNSTGKQEESPTDESATASSQKQLGPVNVESSKECVEIVLLQQAEAVNVKAELDTAAQGCNTEVKAKPLVKRVTWNLETEKDEASSAKPARIPMSYRTHRYNKESIWKPPETSQPASPMPLFPPAAPNYMIPPPIFPGLFPPQAFNQLNMPPPFMPPFPPLHPPPYAPVSQPAPPYIMQGGIPLIGSTPVPPLLPPPTYQAGTAAAQVAVPVVAPPLAAEAHVAQVEANLDTDNKVSEDRTQNENYIKKLHLQERAVEEAKLALKPYYQNKDITKEEYKEILRKAVQKICHSKSGEINPVKVANLVKGYVEKYKHIRKYKKGAEGESSKETDSKAEES